MGSEGDVYSADSIIVLDSLEAVRRRPGMYVGDVRDSATLHHLLWELVANSLDEHLRGHATRIRVSIEGGIAEVEDDGRGIPVQRMPNRDISVLEHVLTTLHAGPTFDSHFPHVHLSPLGWGMGLVVVNALSEELEVEVWQRGYSWTQRFARGRPITELERGARTEKTGTRLRFRPDATISESPRFDRRQVRSRLEELAIWNPDLRLELMSERIHEPGGTARWIERIAAEADTELCSDVFVTRTLRNGILVEVACAWSHDHHGELRSFVGQNQTPDGGTHERGFWDGLVLGLLEHAPSAPRKRRRARLRECLAPGLIGVVHVLLHDAEFDAPTRSRLANPNAGEAVRDQVHQDFAAHLAEHPALAKMLLERIAAL